MTIPLILAEPTQQFNKIFLDPFYRQEMNPNTPYSYTLILDPPDKISEVKSSIITFQLWLNPTIEFFLTVNGQQCNNPSYEVHTTYANAGEGTIYFDCSNVITKAGTYDIVLTPDDDTGAITGWIDLTYMNKPKGSLTLHGTEYDAKSRGKIWLQLLDETGDAVDNAVCYLDVYTPDNREYVMDATMINIGFDGIYVYDFNTPQQQGVYPAIARCYYTASQTFEYADDFELLWGKAEEGDYLRTYVADGTEHRYKELSCGGKNRINFTYTFNDMCGTNISESLLTSLTVTTYQDWASIVNDDITIYIYNFTNSSWIELGNKIHSPNGVTITNSIPINNVTTSGLVNSSGSSILFFEDSDITDGGETRFEMDLLSLSCDQLSTPEWQQIKGSSEIHVSSDFNYVTELTLGEMVNNSFLDGITFYFTVSSQVTMDEEDEPIEITLWKPFPCDKILNVTERFDNGTTQDLSYTSITDDDGRCVIRFTHDLDVATNYYIEIDGQTFWKIRAYEEYYALLFEEEIVNISCGNYIHANNFSDFEIPLVNKPTEDDVLWLTCNSYLDTTNHYKQNAEPLLYFLNKNYNFTLIEVESIESRWEHLIELKYNSEKAYKSLALGLNLADSYSLGLLADPYPPTNPDYVTYFASISTSYLEYIKQQNSTLGEITVSQIWNNPNRNLTYYEDVTNYTRIPEDVWNWNGTIISNILNQFATSIWDFTGTINTAITNYIANSVWTRDNRNLTYYDLGNLTTDSIWNYTNRQLTEFNFEVIVNETKIAEAVWINVNRTLTYFNFTVDVDQTLISDTVWDAVNRTLTDYNQTDITNYQMIQDMVWNASIRTLTSFGFDVVNESDIANSVWTRDNRNLTYYASGDLTTDSIWNYNGRYTHGEII